MVLPKYDSRGSSSTAVAGAGVTARWTAANAGNWAASAKNWSTTTIPGSGSVVILSNSTSGIKVGYTSTEVTAKSLRVQGDYTGNIGEASTPVEISAELAVLNTKAERVNLKGTYSTLVIGKTPSILQLSADTGGGAKKIVVTSSAGNVKLSNYAVGNLIVESGASVTLDGLTRYGDFGPNAMDGPDVIVHRGANLHCNFDELESLRNGGFTIHKGSVGKFVQIDSAAKTEFQSRTAAIQDSDSLVTAGEVLFTGGLTATGALSKIYGGTLACADGTKYTNSNIKVEGSATFRNLAGQTVAIA